MGRQQYLTFPDQVGFYLTAGEEKFLVNSRVITEVDSCLRMDFGAVMKQ